MDLQTCLQKLEYVGVLNFATVGEDGSPQIRNISAIHYEKDGLYFLRREERIFAGSCLATGGSRFLAIRNIRK